jgi:hypothetical protein
MVTLEAPVESVFYYPDRIFPGHILISQTVDSATRTMSHAVGVQNPKGLQSRTCCHDQDWSRYPAISSGHSCQLRRH